MSKELSDIVRDKIVKSRAKGEEGIVLTDHEACEIWSALSSVEADVHNFKYELTVLMQKRFGHIENSLKKSKESLRKAKVTKKRRKRSRK